MHTTTLRIATRKSALALWQTEHVAARLREQHPQLAIELVPLSTRGDEILDRSLATLGGKGLFLKELEVAMEAGRADCAVHSLKDVPMALDAPFVLAAVLERAYRGTGMSVSGLRIMMTPRGKSGMAFHNNTIQLPAER